MVVGLLLAVGCMGGSAPRSRAAPHPEEGGFGAAADRAAPAALEAHKEPDGHVGCDHGQVPLRASAARGPEPVGAETVPFVGFSTLASFAAPPTGGPGRLAEAEIPERIRALDGSRIAIEGFMVPFEVGADGRVRVFYLTWDLLTCSQRGTPKLNEAVEVTLTDPVEDVVGGTVIVAGRLTIEEVRDENDAPVCWYRLRGEHVRRPQ